MRRTTARTPAALAATALLGIVLLPPGTAAVAALAATCHGEVATIVGAWNTPLVGTEGRDVISTNGSMRVTTLGGDDLVCVTPGVDREPFETSVEVDTGTGADVVDGTSTPWSIHAVLGAGADRFEGGPGSDDVLAGTPVLDADGEVAGHLDTETDVLLGGKGSDSLTSGQDGSANPDTVAGGMDNDDVTYQGTVSVGGSLDGGLGYDSLTTPQPAGSTTIDNATGLVTTSTGTGRWGGFEQFELTGRAGTGGPLVFRGTAADEALVAPGGGSVVAELGPGDDEVLLFRAPASGSHLDAGSGDDMLVTTASSGSLDLDLSAGVMRVAGTDTHVVPARGVERTYLAAPTVIIAGTRGEDLLLADACRTRIDGRAGDDEMVAGLRLLPRRGFRCSTARSKLHGGAGDDSVTGTLGMDTLRGGPGNDDLNAGRGTDLVIGGAGRDDANGGPGTTDTCRAERETRCER